MPAEPFRNTYQLKVTLNDATPPIWRRILVPSDIPLGKLHIVLQVAMGWTNSHLHQFVSGGTLYGIQDEEFSLEMEVEDENRYKLDQLLRAEKEAIKYEYDFGDGWVHKIVLEKILPHQNDKQLPLCIKGKRACPPEDCGGIGGYLGLLDILKDPEHPEYEDMVEWLGGELDSEAFDIDETNEMLAEYAR